MTTIPETTINIKIKHRVQELIQVTSPNLEVPSILHQETTEGILNREVTEEGILHQEIRAVILNQEAIAEAILHQEVPAVHLVVVPSEAEAALSAAEVVVPAEVAEEDKISISLALYPRAKVLLLLTNT